MKRIITTMVIVIIVSLAGCKESDYYPPWSEKHKILVEEEHQKNPQNKCDDYDATLIPNGVGGYAYTITCK
jgi:predicted small lipoprotein YifL